MVVNEYDRAMVYLQTPGELSIANVKLLHTRVTQSCDDVESTRFKDGVTCDTDEEEEHRAS